MPTAPFVEIRIHAYPQLTVGGCAVPLQLRRGWALIACLAEPQRRIARSVPASRRGRRSRT